MSELLGTEVRERAWLHAGIACEVVFMGHVHEERSREHGRRIVRSGGHRCGYVRLPVGHPWVGVGLRVPNPELRTGLERSEVQSSCHGGLTFAGLRRGGWWIGFHCSHQGDWPVEWTEDRVAAECEAVVADVVAAMPAWRAAA